MAFPTTTPRTWTVGEVLTAANMNLHLRDQLNELAAAWETDARSSSTIWTGATTNPVLGNGTLTSKYKKMGLTVTWYVRILMGTTTTFGTGTWLFVPPFGISQTRPTGALLALDASSADFADVVHATGANFQGRGGASGVSYDSNTPFAWTSTDEIAFTVTYESTS